MKFKVHPLYILLGLALIATGGGYTFAAYTAAMILHEMGHSAVAARYGYVLDEIKLMPYGAALCGAVEGLKPREDIVIALAGPVFNLILCVIFTAVWWLVPSTFSFTETFVIANLTGALFNLIPAFPLDGGRILLALLNTKMPPLRAESLVKKIGIITAVAFSALFCASIFFGFNLTYCIIAVFIMMGVITESKSSGYKRVINSTYRTRILKKGIPAREIVVSGETPLYAVSRLLNGNYYYRVTVADDACKVMRTITETRLKELLETNADIYKPIEKYL